MEINLKIKKIEVGYIKIIGNRGREVLIFMGCLQDTPNLKILQIVQHSKIIILSSKAINQ